MTDNFLINKLGKNILKEKKIVSELNSLFNHLKNADSSEEKRMVSSQIIMLNKALQKTGQEIINSAEKISLFNLLSTQKTTPIIPAKPTYPQQTQHQRHD